MSILEYYIWAWLLSGLLAFIVGMISDSILYKRKIRTEGVDIPILILSLVMGPVTWLLVWTSIYHGIKRRKKNNGKK